MRYGAGKSSLGMLLVLAGGLIFPSAAQAVPGAREVGAGNDLFKAGRYREAAESYEQAAQKNPSEAAIDYNLGAAYYKDGAFDKAVEHLQKSLLTDNDRLRRDAYFNLGNAFYQSGVSREEEDIGQAVSRLEQSVAQYDKVLAADPKDADAKVNQEFVKKELERLKQKQKQMQQQSRSDKSAADQKDQPGSGQKQASENQEQKPGQPGSEKDKPSGQEPGRRNDVAGEDKAPATGDGTSKPPDAQNGGDPQDRSAGGHDSEHGADRQGQAHNKEGGRNPESQNPAAAGQAATGQVLSQEEARAMLDDFDQNEQPKGLLNFLKEPHDTRQVEKDW